MDDATLDQFAGDTGDGDDTSTGDGAGGSDGDGGAATDQAGGGATGGAAGEAPAVSTFAWTPGGAACAACGAVVEHRWRREAGLVCADCADWE
ncbi:MAG: hypothetical protein ABEH77_02745 [Halobacteriaceae archaeon]